MTSANRLPTVIMQMIKDMMWHFKEFMVGLWEMFKMCIMSMWGKRTASVCVCVCVCVWELHEKACTHAPVGFLHPRALFHPKQLFYNSRLLKREKLITRIKKEKKEKYENIKRADACKNDRTQWSFTPKICTHQNWSVTTGMQANQNITSQ